MSELEPTITGLEPTATERLRALLTERGVEWETDRSGNRVMWGRPVDPFHDTMEFKAVDNALPNGGLNVHICGFTPEQAIAATLGHAYEPPLAAHWDGDTLTLTIPRDPSCIRVQRSAEQPCPFCGGKALYEGYHNLDGFTVPVMFCNWCKALVTFEGFEDYVTAESDGMTELRAAWNRRADA